jgi:hypothetical protein
MSGPCKCPVNPILAKNEVTLADLVVGKEYLLEYNVYHSNRTIKSRGVFIRQECMIPPYVVNYFQTNRWIYPEMYHEALTRYYIPVAAEIKARSLERQAFAQSINKLVAERKRGNASGWRQLSNKNSFGDDLARHYYI